MHRKFIFYIRSDDKATTHIYINRLSYWNLDKKELALSENDLMFVFDALSDFTDLWWDGEKLLVDSYCTIQEFNTLLIESGFLTNESYNTYMTKKLYFKQVLNADV